MPSSFYYSLRQDIGRLNIIIDNVHYFVQKNNCTEDSFEQLIRLCKDYQSTKDSSLLDMIHKITRYGINITNLGDFDYYAHKLYVVGTDVPIPKELVRRLELASTQEEKDSLKAFWLNALMNPDKYARDKFFLYTENFMSPITTNGYVVMYKAVNRVDKELFYPEYFIKYMLNKLDVLRLENPILKDKSYQDVIDTFLNLNEDIHGFLLKDDHVEDITTEHLIERIKHIYATTNDEDLIIYIANNIWDSDITSLEECPSIAELNEAEALKPDVFDPEDFLKNCRLITLYSENGEDNVIQMDEFKDDYDHLFDTVPNYDYYPIHSGTDGMEIRLGEPVKMERTKVDPDKHNECSTGLHVAPLCSNTYRKSNKYGED